MKYLMAVILLVLAPLVQAQRNILLVVVDDLRVTDQAVTPNLDALAAVSTVYTNAYATSVKCLPSRTSVLFGVSAITHGIIQGTDVGQYYAMTEFYGDPANRSLPELMDGYETASTGKIFHHSFPQPARWDVNGPLHPLYRDLTESLGFEDDGTGLTGGVVPDGYYHTDQMITDWAGGYLQTANEPFFLAVGYAQPHLPLHSPQWAYDLYPIVEAHTPITGDLDDEPAKAQSYVNLTQYNTVASAGLAEVKTRDYLAGVSHTDAMIGQLLAHLASTGHADDTDIIVFSDHGVHLGEKTHWQKVTYWQPTVHVPLIIKSPMIPVGEVNTPVSLLDVPSTIMDLAGLPAPAQFEGVSLRTGSSPVAIHYESGEATVTGNTKFIDYDTSVESLEDTAQYNLKNDPEEATNLVRVGC